jgi:hypothetical protein
MNNTRSSPHKARPAPFPSHPPPLPALPQHLVQQNSHSFRRAKMENNGSARCTNPSSPIAQAQVASIYDAFARTPTSVFDREPVIEINAFTPRASALLSPQQVRDRIPSRSSSIDNFNNDPYIHSPSSTMTDLSDMQDTQANFSMLSPSDGGYDSSSTIGRAPRRNRSDIRAHMETAEVLKEDDEDGISARISVSSKAKADKVLGLAAPSNGLVSAYICSGLGLVSQYPDNTPPAKHTDTRILDLRRLGRHQMRQASSRFHGILLATRSPLQCLHW